MRRALGFLEEFCSFLIAPLLFPPSFPPSLPPSLPPYPISARYCVSCVVFPDPVSPRTTSTWRRREGRKEGRREGKKTSEYQEDRPRGGKEGKEGGREGGRTWFCAMPSMNCRLSMKTGRCSLCSLREPFWMKPYDKFFFWA